MDNFWTIMLEQSFGIIALVCTVVSMQLRKKRPLMILQTLSEMFIVSQYLVKGAFTGSLMAVTSFVRDIIVTKFDKKRTPVWVLIVLYVAMTGFTILTWSGPLSLLPYIGSLIYTYTLWYGHVKWIKLGNAVGNTPYIVYTFLTGNYALCIMTLIEVISAVIGFVRYEKNGKSGKTGKGKSRK